MTTMLRGQSVSAGLERSRRGVRQGTLRVFASSRIGRVQLFAAPAGSRVEAPLQIRHHHQRSYVRAGAITTTSAPFAIPSIASDTPIVVLGAQGQEGAQLSKSLLEAGFKVTAGVDFPAQAKATFEFVKKYELLTRAQLANLKLAETEAQLPKRAKVVIIEGDSLGDTKTDARYVEEAIGKAVDAQAAQVVLITSGAAASGGLFSFGGPSPSQPNKALSRSEQVLAASGLSYVVLRVSTSDSVSGEVPVNVAAGPGAVAVAAAPVNDETVALVLGALLRSPAPAPGLPVVLEVTAQRGGQQAVPLTAALAEAISEIKSKAPIPPPPAPVKKEAPSPFSAALGGAPLSLGTISIRRKEEEEDAPAAKGAQKPAQTTPPAKKASANPFGSLFGGRAASDDDDDEEEEKPRAAVRKASPPPPPAKKPVVVAKPVAKKDEDEDDEEEEGGKKPGGFLAGLFGGGNTGTVRLSTSAPKPTPTKPAPPPPKPQPPARSSGTTTVRPASGTATVRAANPFSSVASKRGSTPEPAPAPARAAPPKAAPPKPQPPVRPASGTASVRPASGTGTVRAGNPFSSVASKRAATPEPTPVAAKRTPTPAPPPVPAKRAVSKTPEPESPKSQSGGGFMSFFAIAPKAPASSAPAKAAPPAKPVAKAPAPVSKTAAREPTPPPKKASGGFFGNLFGGRAASDDDDDEEEEVKPRAAVRKASPPPPPAKKPVVVAKPVAKPVAKAAPAPAPSRPASNPFSSVKRVAPPPPAPAKPAPAKSTGTQRTGTQTAKPAPPAAKPSGTTNIKGTYRPVSGYGVEPKKK